MTNVLATSDNPGNNNFIDGSAQSAKDWRNDNNNNRWATTPQGPCPAGWHVPTESEWSAETSNTQGGTATSGGITNRNSAYAILKLTTGGYRRGFGSSAGQITNSTSYGTGYGGFYWSSTAYTAGSTYLDFASSYAEIFYDVKSLGCCVRCVKN
jgi:uncharacterized protein (TIGR02145 family)